MRFCPQNTEIADMSARCVFNPIKEHRVICQEARFFSQLSQHSVSSWIIALTGLRLLLVFEPIQTNGLMSPGITHQRGHHFSNGSESDVHVFALVK